MTDQPRTTDHDADPATAMPDPFADMGAAELRDIARDLDAELASELEAHGQSRAARARAQENLAISRSESKATKIRLERAQQLQWEAERAKRRAIGAAALMGVITALALAAVLILAIKLP